MPYAFEVVRPLAYIPNQNGFKFIGVLKDDTCVDCEVVRNAETGMHEVAFRYKTLTYEDLKGWKYKKQ